MKQIKFFNVPEEIGLANEFLANNPPESVATVSKGEQCFCIVNYDDQTYPDTYKAEEIRGLMLSNTKESMTSKISKDIMGLDLKTYQEDLAKHEIELDEVNALVVPMVETATGKKKGKEVPDYAIQAEKTKKAAAIQEKITGYTAGIKNIEEGMKKLDESIARFEKKNTILQKHLDALNLPQA